MSATGKASLLLASLLLAGAAGPVATRLPEPEVRALSVRGLQTGGTTTLVVDGDSLGTSPRLLLPFPARQMRRPGGTPTQATFEVTLDPAVPAGLYHLRVATEGGVSLPVVVGVDALPQRPLDASVTASPQTLPVALHGTVGGSAVIEARFVGKAGQKVTAEVEARRLGSRLRPVLHLSSQRRLQLAWSWPVASLGGDTRVEATLPEDGVYTVAVHDLEYAAGAPGHFRLRVGQLSFVDAVFPPLVGRETRAVELIGSEALRVELPPANGENGEGVITLPWPPGRAWSGPRPFVRRGTRLEVVKDASAARGQELPAGQVAVSGRLLAPDEEDRYRIPVNPGGKVRLEVQAERLGSPLDATLVVRNEAGAEVARAEDGPGTLDPILEYSVPAGVSALRVGVLDAQHRGGPRAFYRLLIDPAGGATPPDFHLATPARRVTLSVSGRAVVPVRVERRGYAGPVELLAEGLPAGVRLEGTTIPAGADGALVTVERGPWTGEVAFTRWRGRASDGRERPVVLEDDPLEQLQPWLATELPVATSGNRAADFQVEWGTLPPDLALVPARKLVLPLKLSRPGTPSLVRLTLLTSQLPPLVNGAVNAALALRAESVVELPFPVVEGTLAVVVPTDLPSSAYDVAVQAELLTPDRRTVLATAVTTVRRLAVRLPVVLQLDGPTSIEARRDPRLGLVATVRGRVERHEGFTGEVDLAVAGLPAGGRSDAVKVRAGESAFAVPVVLPAGTPAGTVAGLKLAGTVTPDAKQPGVRVRSRDVEFTLAIPAIPAGK